MKLSFLIAVSWVCSVEEVVCWVFWFCETFETTRRDWGLLVQRTVVERGEGLSSRGS